MNISVPSSGTGVEIESTSAGQEVQAVLSNVTPGETQDLEMNISYLSGTSYRAVVTEELIVNGAAVITELAGVIIGNSGLYTIPFTPSATNGGQGIRVSITANGAGTTAYDPGWYKVTYVPQNTVVRICNTGLDRYRFGWNTHEKVNEIAGIGNHTTAEFGEFDTRLGRRWNVDPVETIGVSPYAVNLNNPILYNDPDGDCPWCWSAIIGGALDAGFQLANIAMSDDMMMSDFSWSSVGISMVAGATGYGLSTVVESGVARMAAGRFVKAVVKTSLDVGTDMGVGLVEDYAKTGEVNFGDALENAVLGQGVGKAAEKFAEPIIKNSPEVKSLEKKAERLERKARNNPKESPNTNRNRDASQAREKYDKAVANKVGRAATVSSGAATKTKDLIKSRSKPGNGSGSNGGGRIVAPAPRPCFVAGTLVATNNGYTAIEHIQDGDSVLTYNIQNRRTEYQIVQGKYELETDSIVTIILPSGEQILTTPAHSFYVNRAC